MTCKTTVDVINPKPESIYCSLARKLGRNPTNAECKAECHRITSNALIDMAATPNNRAGKE